LFGIAGIVAIVLIVYVFFMFNNALNQSPAYQNLQPSQQSTVQSIQSVGGQTLSMSDTTLLETIAVILAAIGGIAGLVIALVKRR
jgi:hypothetical protein